VPKVGFSLSHQFAFALFNQDHIFVVDLFED
jgi:hypothetical protein